MKKLLFLPLWFCFLCLALQPSASAEAETAEEAEIIIASDLHYISPALTDNGDMFMRVLANGDGKLSQYSEEITDAFLEDVVARRPTALVITGDLTFNGALQSHLDLAGKLLRVQEEGIPVFVFHGNHDVFNRNAARFSGSTFERLPLTMPEEIRSTYAAFGYAQALSRDTDSLCYTVPLNAATVLLMLDFNTLHDFCDVSVQTLRWIEEQLQQLRTEGKRVIAFGHQNLFQHSIFSGGYVIRKAGEVRRLFERYNVSLFLSGHMHIQHILEKKGVTEIVTSALSLYPCRYGILSIAGKELSYRTQAVDVSAWARRQGRTEKELLNFDAFAESSFEDRTRSQSEAALSESGLSGQEKQKLVDYAVAVQKAVFSGDLTGLDSLDPDGSTAQAWKNVGNMHGYYLSTAAADSGKDFNFWQQQEE